MINGEVGISRHSEFKIDNEEQKYRLHVSGNAGLESLHDGAFFSATDVDNDNWGNNACSDYATGRGGFWFTACGSFYPNAYYYQSETVNRYHGMVWVKWLDERQSLKGTEMMI